jgi:tetratricopeptide (TPR) repeat protein
MVGLFKKSPELVERKKALQRKKELKKLVKTKKYQQVLKVGNEILEKIPNDLDVLFVLGGIYHMKGLHKKAISYFDKVLEISSYDPQVLILKAKSTFVIGKYDETEICCNKLIEIDPKNKSVSELLTQLNS